MRPIVAARVAWSVGLSVRSICRLGCGLGLAEASTSSIAFARCCQFAVTGESLALAGQSDPTICLLRRCGLMSNYFDHLLSWSSPFPPVDNIWAMMTVQQRIREKTIKLFCAVLCSKTHTYKQFLQLTIGIGFFDLGFFCVFFAILFVCCFLLLC